MRIYNIPGHDLLTLAVWPQPAYERGLWHMYALKLREDMSLHWYKRYVDKNEGTTHLFADTYAEYTEAIKAANILNKELADNINLLSVNEVEKESLQLKFEKALTAKKRLINEEQLMFEVALKNHTKSPRLSADEIIINSKINNLRTPLFEILQETPYIRFAFLHKYHVSLILNESEEWVNGWVPSKQAAKIYYQERIAGGFGFSGLNHWGKTKSAIRSLLLPRANQLLQLASVKRMLSEARIRGQKVLLLDGFVFWFEEHGQVGWTVKEASDSGAGSKGNTLWKEGTILSKNHGRIVVLPYQKENGERVQGHTKNPPHDGKALPRHRDEYVELPFEVLDGDVMRGLFGELYYE